MDCKIDSWHKISLNLSRKLINSLVVHRKFYLINLENPEKARAFSSLSGDTEIRMYTPLYDLMGQS